MNQGSTESTLQVQGFTPYAQIPQWILRSQGKLSGNSVQLYGIIMSYADNDTKTAFPSREKLAEDMGVSVATVKRCIKDLEAYGALIVERRRNKRTGNFYANHYTLIFNSPRVTGDPRREVTGDPITTPTVELDSPSFTSEQSSEDVAPPTQASADTEGSSSYSPGELADPISPEFHRSADRKHLVSLIKSTAEARKRGKEGMAEDLTWKFIEAAETILGGDEAICYMIIDHCQKPYKIKAIHTDGRRAGKWLNQLINDARLEVAADFTWCGEHHELAA